MHKNLIPLLLASVFVIQPVFAQEVKPVPAPAPAPVEKEAAPAADKPVNPTYSPILPVKIKPRQGGADSISKAAADVEQENKLNPDSLGLYTRVSDGGLGADVWKDYTSAKLAEDLSKLNLNISSPVFRTLLLRALLTAPDAQTFAADKEVSEAFSARVTTLIDLGAFEETVTLYKKLEGNIPSAKAALAGAEGIVSSGKMGLACLEEKALSPELKQTDSTSFWPDLNNFCKILLTTDTPETDDDKASFAKASTQFVTVRNITAVSALTELNGKSIIEILAMNKTGTITKSLFTPDNVKTLKPQIIALLLAQSPETQNEQLSLKAVAADKGLIPAADFTTAFITQAATSTAPTIPPGYWQPLLSLYGKVQSAASDKDKSLPLKEVLKITGASKNAALLPFAGALGSLKNADAFTPEEARKVVSLLIRSKINVSGAWFAQAFGKPDVKAQESVTDIEVIAALKDAKSASQPAPEVTPEGDKAKSDNSASKEAKTTETIEKAQLDAISLILQTQEAEDKIKEKSYEKLFSLTGINDYVMPSKELMNNLTEAAARQDTGKVILYSLQILNGQRVSQLHPLALFRISEGLQSVGLSEENRSLAHEVLADLIEY